MIEKHRGYKPPMDISPVSVRERPDETNRVGLQDLSVGRGPGLNKTEEELSTASISLLWKYGHSVTSPYYVPTAMVSRHNGFYP